MGVSRSIRRHRARESQKVREGRQSCPKCHNRKLVKKAGYGIVCDKCGWEKPESEGGQDEQQRADQTDVR